MHESAQPLAQLAAIAAALLLLLFPPAASAIDVSGCSWPLETTGSGLTNVAYPDTNATYWTMPLDRSRWKSMIIEGEYPQARFFSFVSYTANGAAVDDIVDVDIDPDSGSANPFRQGSSGSGRYTVTVGGDALTNNIALEDSQSRLV